MNTKERYNQNIKESEELWARFEKLSLGRECLALKIRMLKESVKTLESDLSEADTQEVKYLYQSAEMWIPRLHRAFEETLDFHNKLIKEEVKYVVKTLPDLNKKLASIQKEIDEILDKEALKVLSERTGR